MNKTEAAELLEDVLDTLVERDNGATAAMMKEAVDKLFKFRDEWFKEAHVIEGKAHDVEQFFEARRRMCTSCGDEVPGTPGFKCSCYNPGRAVERLVAGPSQVGYVSKSPFACAKHQSYACYDCHKEAEAEFEKLRAIHLQDMVALADNDKEIKKSREDLTRIMDKWNAAEEKLALAMKVAEVARWLAHVNCGVSKDGGEALEDESRSALEAVQDALEELTNHREEQEPSGTHVVEEK